jgi:aminoglycoside 6-adenylyltransferase
MVFLAPAEKNQYLEEGSGMRTDKQVQDQLLTFAQEHECIRAVVMNGSRVNPNAPQDFFCDFDIVYYCTDPMPFLNDRSWIPSFGELVILQQNDFEDHGLSSFIFLLLFQDGIRIDLSFNFLANLAYLDEDTLTRVLLDKDGRIAALPPSSDVGYYPVKPTRKVFDETVNEIFWCSNNLAKGIWRGELPYVKTMQDVIIRDALLKLLEWYAAMQHGWQVSPGKFGKWLEKFLPPEIWQGVVRTYAGAAEDEIWEAQFEICRLTRRIGTALADEMGYEYPLLDDQRTVEYLKHVRTLSHSAASFDG